MPQKMSTDIYTYLSPHEQNKTAQERAVRELLNHLREMTWWSFDYSSFITNHSPTISQGYNGAKKTPKHHFNDAFAPHEDGLSIALNPISWIH